MAESACPAGAGGAAGETTWAYSACPCTQGGGWSQGQAMRAAEGAGLGILLGKAERVRIRPVAPHDQHRQAGDSRPSPDRPPRPFPLRPPRPPAPAGRARAAGAAPVGYAAVAPATAAGAKARVASVGHAAEAGPAPPAGPSGGARKAGDFRAMWGARLVGGMSGLGDQVAAVSGVDDVESAGGGTDALQAQQHGADARAEEAMLVPVPAVRAAPDVPGPDPDRGPVAQLARWEAELLVWNMRVDWAAGARYAAKWIRRALHDEKSYALRCRLSKRLSSGNSVALARTMAQWPRARYASGR